MRPSQKKTKQKRRKEEKQKTNLGTKPVEASLRRISKRIVLIPYFFFPE